MKSELRTLTSDIIDHSDLRKKAQGYILWIELFEGFSWKMLQLALRKAREGQEIILGTQKFSEEGVLYSDSCETGADITKIHSSHLTGLPNGPSTVAAPRQPN